MNTATAPLNATSLPPEVLELINSQDGPAFEQALDTLVRQREQHVFRALGMLARDLHGAICRLGGELAHEGVHDDVRDMRHYLDEVLDMSDRAAHRSLDFVERLRPQADALGAHAAQLLDAGTDPAALLARQAAQFAATCAEGLDDMLMMQSWQDLAGQRVKKVVAFIGSVESSLLELVRLTGMLGGHAVPEQAVKVASQDEADRLLSEFGF